jgi:hypothetical protein
MLHPSLHALYVPQRTLFGRLLRLAFALAGIFWFLLYAMPAEQHAAFRSGQSVIYFILLSLWGIDYLREAKRLAFLIRTANEKGCAPNEVVASDIGSHRRMFAVVPWFDGSVHILSLGMWLALTVALILVSIQYMNGITVFFN